MEQGVRVGAGAADRQRHVPEDAYDRFYGYASADPPNYPAACKVLVEAAAEDTVMTTALDTSRGGDDQ